MSGTIVKFPGGRQSPTAGADSNAPPTALAAEPPDCAAPLRPRPLTRLPRPLLPAEQALQDRMLQGFFDGVRPAQNHDPKTIRRDRQTVQAFLTYVGQPVWACAPSDFESWAAHLHLERDLAAGSQRVLQGAVATFFDYLVNSEEWQNAALQDFNARIRQVATATNRVVHAADTPRRPRSYLTGNELTQIFAVLDSVIELAAIECPRRLKAFQRDRVMFYVFYAYGLRLKEGHGLNLSSFFTNSDLPEMGRYGFAGVYGKGSRGSGPRYRAVPCIHPDVPPAIDWYLSEVRPKFNCRNHDAMWLSERGNRLCRSAIANRFKSVLTACGLDASLFSTHGLRHMSVSHQAEADIPLAYISKTHGHVHMATTTTYTHLSDDYLRTVAQNVVRAVVKPTEAT